MSGPAGLRYERYADGEWLMRIGPEGGPTILFLPPLFEEMNRTRPLIAAIMRELAARGFDCRLPDLPGTGESERGLGSVDWEDWRAAIGAIGHTGVVAGIRGGCLLDDAASARAHWRMAPVTGASLRRDLDRASLAGGATVAGYPAAEALLDSLKAAESVAVTPLRVVRLASDAADADCRLVGPALWRRSEPGTSGELARAAAEDITLWAERCAAC